MEASTVTSQFFKAFIGWFNDAINETHKNQASALFKIAEFPLQLYYILLQ